MALYRAALAGSSAPLPGASSKLEGGLAEPIGAGSTQGRLTLGADNLFDKAYYAPLSGMSLGDLKATGVRRPVPGRGRSVNAGITIAF